MLNRKEIKEIQKYVRKYYTSYKDVELELVDHLASIVEQSRAINKEKSFSQHLNIAFKVLPSREMKKLIEEKEKSLQQFWKRRIKQYFLEFISWPKLLILILLSSLFYFLFSQVELPDSYNMLYFLSNLVLVFIPLIISNWVMGNSLTKENEEFLSVQAFFKARIIVDICLPTVVAVIPFLTVFQNIWFIYLLSILVSLFCILQYALLFHFPNQIKKDIIKVHEQYYLQSA